MTKNFTVVGLLSSFKIFFVRETIYLSKNCLKWLTSVTFCSLRCLFLQYAVRLCLCQRSSKLKKFFRFEKKKEMWIFGMSHIYPVLTLFHLYSNFFTGKLIQAFPLHGMFAAFFGPMLSCKKCLLWFLKWVNKVASILFESFPYPSSDFISYFVPKPNLWTGSDFDSVLPFDWKKNARLAWSLGYLFTANQNGQPRYGESFWKTIKTQEIFV